MNSPVGVGKRSWSRERVLRSRGGPMNPGRNFKAEDAHSLTGGHTDVKPCSQAEDMTEAGHLCSRVGSHFLTPNRSVFNTASFHPGGAESSAVVVPNRSTNRNEDRQCLVYCSETPDFHARTRSSNRVAIISALGKPWKQRKIRTKQNTNGIESTTSAAKFNGTIHIKRQNTNFPLNLQLRQSWQKKKDICISRAELAIDSETNTLLGNAGLSDASSQRRHSLDAATDQLNIRGSNRDVSKGHEPVYIKREIDLKSKLGIINPSIQALVEVPIVNYHNKDMRCRKSHQTKHFTIMSQSESGLDTDIHDSLPGPARTYSSDRQTKVQRNLGNFKSWGSGKELVEVDKKDCRSFTGFTLNQKKRAQLLAKVHEKSQSRNRPSASPAEPNNSSKAVLTNTTHKSGSTSRPVSRGKSPQRGRGTGGDSETLKYDVITSRMPVIVPPAMRRKQRVRDISQNRKRTTCKSNSSDNSLDSSLDLLDWQGKLAMRFRTELPPAQPRKLCFKTSLPGCTHLEVKKAIENQSGATVVWMQYDPLAFSRRRGEFSCYWIFQLSSDADVEPLIFEGLSLHGVPVNVRRLDDVYKEEFAAYRLCSEVFTEQNKKELTRKYMSTLNSKDKEKGKD